MLGVTELMCRGLVNGKGYGAGVGIWLLAGVDLLGFERPILAHGYSCVDVCNTSSLTRDRAKSRPVSHFGRHIQYLVCRRFYRTRGFYNHAHSVVPDNAHERTPKNVS